MTTAAGAAWGGYAVPLRRRTDLEVRPSYASPAQAWLVKDPISLRYFELPEEEHFLWSSLDGRATWSELRERYERTFAPRQIDGLRLSRLLEELHERGLVVSDRTGQGAALQERGRRLRRKERLRRFANPLAIRLPGIDPQPLLDRLRPIVEPLFTKAGVAACLAVVALAVVTAIVHAGDFGRELVAAARFPQLLDLWPWLVAVAGAKVVHELAHAVACRRFGGECREIGLLVLCGVPCLYCDVTSIWMTPERWKRIAVGAAGMAAEVVLAAVAVLVWRFTEPGLLHNLSLHLAVVCSVATIVVNANPLLRYDGYFILADTLGMMNLGEQADAAVRSVATNWLFGESLENERRAPPRWRGRLAAFGAASTAYRSLLTIAVLWFFRRLLAPHGLTLVSDLLTLVVVGSLVVGPVRQAVRFVKVARVERRGDMRRFATRTLAVVLFAAALLLWPWSYDVAAPAVVRLKDAEYLYAVVGGTLADGARLGDEVQPGDVIARLEDPQLRLEALRLEADVARRRLEIAGLERRRVADPAAGEELPVARERLAAAERQFQHVTTEQGRLRIVAARSGTVLPLFGERDKSNLPEDTDDGASPLEPQRRGAYLPAGTPVCAVGDPRSLQAELLVDQHEIEFVRPGQTVRLRFEAAPERVWIGRIVETAELALDEVPAELVAAGESAKTDAAGRPVPIGTQYLARVAFEESSVDLPVGVVGRAKIEAAPQSLWARLLRAAEATFRFAWSAP